MRAGALSKRNRGVSDLPTVRAAELLRDGDRVFLRGDHPWAPSVGTLIAYEKYGLGWWGWRVELDNPHGQECYAAEKNLLKVEGIKR